MLTRYVQTYPIEEFMHGVAEVLNVNVAPAAQPKQITNHELEFSFGKVEVVVSGDKATITVYPDYDYFKFPPEPIIAAMSDYVFDLDNQTFTKQIPLSSLDNEEKRLKEIFK